jgi:hypothetical protein
MPLITLDVLENAVGLFWSCHNGDGATTSPSVIENSS